MGLPPDYYIRPCPIFQSDVVDFVRPIEYRCTVNKRKTGKGLGSHLCVYGMSAVHFEFIDTHSMDSFLMALWRFMCAKGTPSRIQSTKETNWW
jgi:hypothetical protein